MAFMPAEISTITGSAALQRVLVCLTDTRESDYAIFRGRTLRHADRPSIAWNPGLPQGAGFRPVAVGPGIPNSPATLRDVYWNDASAFCVWLTLMEHANKELPIGYEYRLPTDEEWNSLADALAGGNHAAPTETRHSYDRPTKGVRASFRAVIAPDPLPSPESQPGDGQWVVREWIESPEFAGYITAKMRPGALRQEMKIAGAGDSISLLDFSAGTGALIFPEKRLAQTAPASTFLESGRAALPPSQQGSWSKPVSIHRKEHVGPWIAEVYAATWGTAKVTLWVTSDIPGWESVKSELTALAQPLAGLGFDAAALDVPGLAVKTEIVDGTRKTQQVILGLVRMKVPPEEFTVPAGYTITPFSK
jgi:hypothetical protein